MSEMTGRYTAREWVEIDSFFKELAKRTRKSGKISPSRRANIMVEWEAFDADVVIDAIRLYLRMETTPAQNERYLKGIMRNKQKEKEKEAGAYGKRGTDYQKETGAASGDEGERLRRKYAAGGGELACDF